MLRPRLAEASLPGLLLHSAARQNQMTSARLIRMRGLSFLPFVLLVSGNLLAQTTPPAPPPDSTKAERVEGRRAIYPQEAIDKGIKGPVQVKVVFDETGSVIGGDFVSGDPMLMAAALDTVRKYWKFKPYYRGGHPVQVRVPETVEFRLPNPAADNLPESTKADVTHLESANYPLSAEETQVQGQVIVRAHVSDEGNVTSAEVVSSTNGILNEAALAAMKKWKFKPYIHEGEPASFATTVPFNFAFRDRVMVAEPSAPSGSRASPLTQNTLLELPQRVRVSSGVAAGSLLRKVQPIYPLEARQYSIQGTVLLKGIVGKDGSIIELHPISGPRELQDAAIGAVKQWLYRPFLLEGRPVEVETQIQVNFTLAGR